MDSTTAAEGSAGDDARVTSDTEGSLQGQGPPVAAPRRHVRRPPAPARVVIKGSASSRDKRGASATAAAQTIAPPGADYVIEIEGAERADLRDFYHLLLRHSWGTTLGVVGALYLGANALFAFAYWLVGGVGHGIEAHPSFIDAFFFSVQTMGTIGYGALVPESTAANCLVVAESITGLTLTALFTGLVFSKFSRATSRILFSREATISLVNGAPTLAFRLGNARGNQIVDAQLRLTLVRSEITAEGHQFFRTYDLKLQRERVLSLSRSWTVLHVIDADSPFHGQTPATLLSQEAELLALVVGIDDVSMQTMHALHRYFAPQIVWGARHVDILSEKPNGNLLLDLRRFHDTEPTKPSAAFPYPAA